MKLDARQKRMALIGSAILLAVLAVAYWYTTRQRTAASATALSGAMGSAGGTAAVAARDPKADRPGDAGRRATIERALG